MTLNDIINTLKHDGTNPSINKEALVKALEEVQKELAGKGTVYHTEESIDDLPDELLDVLLPGDTVVVADSDAYLVIFKDDELVLSQLYLNIAIAYAYTYTEGEGWSVTAYNSYLLPSTIDQDGKILGVNNDKPEWVEPTKLYKHFVTAEQTPGATITLAIFISNSPDSTTYLSADGTNGLSIEGYIISDITKASGVQKSLFYARAGVTNVLGSDGQAMDLSGWSNFIDIVTPL